MAAPSTEGNVHRREWKAPSFVSGVVSSWFVAAIFNVLSGIISATFDVLVWLISETFNALVWLISAIFNALVWLVFRIRNLLWFLITSISSRVSLLCNSVLLPETLVRLFGAAMILATFLLFNSSVYISSLDTTVAWIWRCCILVQGLLLLPLPRPMNLRQILQIFQNQRFQSIPYDALKASGAMGCYFAFNWLGSTVEIHNDQHIMLATISYFLFLVIVDLLYDIEEAFEICEGYIFAGYGLMLGQEVVNHYIIHPTCFSFCFLKNYMRTNRGIILALIDNPKPTTEVIELTPTLVTQATAIPEIQNQSDAGEIKEEDSHVVLDISDVVRGDQKVLYRPKSFTRISSKNDEVGY